MGTKIVGRQDIGKVFACIASIQSVVELVGPVYHLIYLGTIDWYPGFAYCVSAFILIIMIVLTIYCRWFLSRVSTASVGPVIRSTIEEKDTNNNQNYSSIANYDPIYKHTHIDIKPK